MPNGYWRPRSNATGRRSVRCATSPSTSSLSSCGTRASLLPFAPTPTRSGFRTRSRSTSTSTQPGSWRSEEHTSELQSHVNLVCRLLLEKKKRRYKVYYGKPPLHQNDEGQ